MLNNSDKSTQQGFSLVELMIGIVILAILSAVAIPSFQNWLLNSQIRNAAESISNGLQRARAEAVSRNADVEFELSVDSSWVVRVAGGADIETRSSNEGSKSVTATPDPVGNNIVTFNSFGSIKSAPAPFTKVDVDSATMGAAESQNLRITIGFGGNIRMCDPNAAPGSPRAC